LFATASEENRFNKTVKIYQVNLKVNGEDRNMWPGINYKPHTKEHSIPGFDVMLKSPILLKENEVVRMDAGIIGPASHYGWRGETTVKVQGITVTFLDSSISSDSDTCNKRTCVSQGQFHQIILSV
jgi:hypothetical protein